MSKAALPRVGYRPPPTLTYRDNVPFVRVFPEGGGKHADFGFPPSVTPVLARQFAIAFERATTPGGGRRTVKSAESVYSAIRQYSRWLATLPSPPATFGQFRPRHIDEYMLLKGKASRPIIMTLRSLLRRNDELTPEFHARLFAPQPPMLAAAPKSSYEEGEYRAIVRAARNDTRFALQRVRAARAELTAYRTGALPEHDSARQRRAEILDYVDTHADMPRKPSGAIRPPQPGSTYVSTCTQLFPTIAETAAMITLMLAVTGQNLSTISELQAEYRRTDSGQPGELPVAILDAVKPRRGRARAEMSIVLTDVPIWMGERSRRAPDGDDYASAFGVFQIAREITSRARTLMGTSSLWAHWDKHPREGSRLRLANDNTLSHWLKHTDPTTGAPTTVDSMRIRRTFLALHQRPVAHTPRTLAAYLSMDPGTTSDYQSVVAAALDEQFEQAIADTTALIYTPDDIRRFRESPDQAVKHGITRTTMSRLIAGTLDTVATACVDNSNSPYSPAASPCTASFLLCLGCPNARSEPRHVPVQAAMLEEIETRRSVLTAPAWIQQFGAAHARLSDLLTAQGADPVDAARNATADDRALISALLDGRVDIR